MKKTSFLPILSLALFAASFLTAFSVKKSVPVDKEPSFDEFLLQFPAHSLPYSLDEQRIKLRLDEFVLQRNSQSSVNNSSKTNRLNWEFFDFLPDLRAESAFSRIPMQVEPVARFSTANNYAVIYRSSRSFGGAFCEYALVVFDKNGQQISSNTVGSGVPETITSANISSALQAEVRTWRINWKKDYHKNGADGNKIQSLSYVESRFIDLMQPTESHISTPWKKYETPERKQRLAPASDIKTK